MSYDSEELQALRLRVAELADMVETCELDIYTKAGRQTLIDGLWKAAHVNSDLAKAYVKARRLNGDNAEEVEDRARELAISFIVSGGYDCDDSDLGGDPMGDTVQTHLMIAFMRQPDMMRHHEEAMVEGGDKGEFGDREEDDELPLRVGDWVRQRPRFGQQPKLPPLTTGLVKEVNGDRVRVEWPDTSYAPTVGSADDFILHEREHQAASPCGQPRREFSNLFLIQGHRYKVTFRKPSDLRDRELVGQYDKEDGDKLYFEVPDRTGTKFVKVYKHWIKDITDTIS